MELTVLILLMSFEPGSCSHFAWQWRSKSITGNDLHIVLLHTEGRVETPSLGEFYDSAKFHLQIVNQNVWTGLVHSYGYLSDKPYLLKIKHIIQIFVTQIWVTLLIFLVLPIFWVTTSIRQINQYISGSEFNSPGLENTFSTRTESVHQNKLSPAGISGSVVVLSNPCEHVPKVRSENQLGTNCAVNYQIHKVHVTVNWIRLTLAF